MKKLIALLLVIIFLIVGCSAPATPVVTPELQQKLDLLVEQLEQQRQTLHVLGMAIAVVKDDEVVLTHGFGIADIEEEVPVTPETIFAIGSATKAFTSALAGMLVDEGKMDWDDPVTEYLPYFQMDIASTNASDEITLRDVLSHRTGFTRMGLLFASGQIPIEEVLLDATGAEPYVSFREKFYYSNVMYMSAGVAAGKAEGTDWDTLVAERIFEPLGMNSTTTSITEAENDSRLASGYLWDEDLQDYEYKPMRNVDNIGPSGSINSNVIDMAEWLRLQLNRGEYEGHRLISEENLIETWTTQIDIAANVGYGMGWMIREWQGQPVVEHGGNVDGFSAQVAILPESNLGFVLLTNASVSPLPSSAVNIVWDALLGEDPADGGATEDYEPYLGNYVANFGTFKDEIFTVLVQNGRLAIDIPGQQVYELKDPDEEGKWYFVISSDIAVSFERDEDDNVIVMYMYQSGLTFESPREGVEIEPEIPLEELQKYLGTYSSEGLQLTVEILIQNNRLAIDVPDAMVYELYPPDENDRWVFRVTPELGVSFNETAAGQVDSLTLYQSGQEWVLPQIENKRLPTVDEIMALRDAEGNEAALEAMGNYRIDSTIYSVQSGVNGTVSTYVAGSDKYRVDADYGKYGYSHTVVNGDQAWVESSFGPFRVLRGQLLEQAKRGHPYVMDRDWRDYFDSIKVVRADTLDDKEVYVMELKSGDLPAMTVYVDAVTGDVLLSEVTSMQEGGIGIPVTTRFENFQEMHGIRIPLRSIATNEESGWTIFEEETIETNIDLDEDFFILTPPEE